MRFKFDENLPRTAVELYEEEGHDCESVLTEDLGGATDAELSKVVRGEERILVSFDTDFADIRTYPPEDYPGFVVLRLGRQDIPSTVSLLRETLPLLEADFQPGSLWIVEDDRIRIR